MALGDRPAVDEAVGRIPQDVRAAVLGLPLPILEELGEALLDFISLAELKAWLAE